MRTDQDAPSNGKRLPLALLAACTGWLAVGTAGLAAALTAAPPAQNTAPTPDAAAQAARDFDDTVRRGDSLAAAGNYFEAVLAFERAKRVAYNNKLKIDAAALDAKLAAARSARDAGKAAPEPSPAAQAPATPRASAPPPPGPSAAPTSALNEYEDAVRHGDALAASGDYLEAIKEFERAGRISYNNKLATDSAALDAKKARARAAQAGAAAAPAELLPAPPPPVAGYQAALNRRLPNQPGKFRPWRFVNYGTDSSFRASAADLKTFEANLQRIVEVMKKVPVLSPPTGFDIDFNGDAASPENAGPIAGRVSFGAYGYFEEQVRVKATGELRTRPAVGDETDGAEIAVNRLPSASGWEDSEGRMFLEPPKRGEIGGFPVYGKDLYIVRTGEEVFAPVTMERFLKVWIAVLKKWADSAEEGLASRRKEAQAALSPETREKRRREIEAQRAKGGSGVEQNVRHLEAMHRRWEDDARKVLEEGDKDPKYREPVQAYKDAVALAALPGAAERAATPCFQNAQVSFEFKWKLVPAAAGNCRRVVKANAALFRRGAPRSALQLLSVPSVTDCSQMLVDDKSARENTGGCLAVVRILRALDWKQLAALLQP